MFCPKCGKPLVEGAEFCSSCGARVEVPKGDGAPVPSAPAHEPPVQADTKPADKKAGPDKTAVIAIAAAAVAVIAILLVFVLRPKKEVPPPVPEESTQQTAPEPVSAAQTVDTASVLNQAAFQMYDMCRDEIEEFYSRYFPQGSYVIGTKAENFVFTSLSAPGDYAADVIIEVRDLRDGNIYNVSASGTVHVLSDSTFTLSDVKPSFDDIPAQSAEPFSVEDFVGHYTDPNDAFEGIEIEWDDFILSVAWYGYRQVYYEGQVDLSTGNVDYSSRYLNIMGEDGSLAVFEYVPKSESDYGADAIRVWNSDRSAVTGVFLRDMDGTKPQDVEQKGTVPINAEYDWIEGTYAWAHNAVNTMKLWFDPDVTFWNGDDWYIHVDYYEQDSLYWSATVYYVGGEDNPHFRGYLDGGGGTVDLEYDGYNFTMTGPDVPGASFFKLD